MKADTTVLITVKDEEKYIGASIKSVLDQTYKNFELWVIGDGSADGTWKVIKSFKDRRIKAFRFEKNTGMTPRLNRAIPQIRTTFLARMDSHNLADKSRLQKQHDYMGKHPEVMALGSNFTRVDESGKIILTTNFPTEYAKIKSKLIEKNLFKHASMFIRREVYDKVGLYDPYFKLTQDYDFILRVAAKFSVANLSESLITEIYRLENSSQKHRVRLAWETLVSQWNAVIKYEYPTWQSIYLLRGIGFLIKSQILQLF